MDLKEGSETSAKLNLTPGKYPKEKIQNSEHGENLKSRRNFQVSGGFRIHSQQASGRRPTPETARLLGPAYIF
jgi:hypothetical protein